MVRAVSADHVFFQECIQAFRPGHDSPLFQDNLEKTGYLLLDFEMPYQLVFKELKIGPSLTKRLSNFHQSTIAPVTLLNYKEPFNSHLYIIALSSIVSFVYSRPVKAPKDAYIADFANDLNDLYILFPYKGGGTGAVETIIAEKNILTFHEEIEFLIGILYKLPYDDYERIMQSIRLINLAHLSKREDFALAYYLLVSAIESVSQMAIPKKEQPEDEKEAEKLVEELAKVNTKIKPLLDKYKVSKENSYQLSRRFREFILTYCAPSEWDNVEHPDDYMKDDPEYKYIYDEELINRAQRFKPSRLKPRFIKEIINDSYTYRSKFTHEGQPPPNTQPEPYEHFFEVIMIKNEKKGLTEKYVMSYRLLAFIAKKSIMSYLKTRS